MHAYVVVAFLVALNQNKELIGSNGLLPIPIMYSRLRRALQASHQSMGEDYIHLCMWKHAIFA